MPADLASQAYVAGSGEPLWSIDSARELVDWARAEGWAILAGETYRAAGQMQTSFVADWETPRGVRGQEPWPAYLSRSAERALAELERHSHRPDATLRFYLIAVPESEARGD